MKLSKKQIREIKRLRKKGSTYREIGEKFKVAEATIQYHDNEDYKKKQIKRAREKIRNLTKEEMREKNKKYYNPEYYKNRYKNEPKFRSMMIRCTRRGQKILYKKRKKQGLCTMCGNKAYKKNKYGKRYLACKKCREKNKQRMRRR